MQTFPLQTKYTTHNSFCQLNQTLLFSKIYDCFVTQYNNVLEQRWIFQCKFVEIQLKIVPQFIYFIRSIQGVLEILCLNHLIINYKNMLVIYSQIIIKSLLNQIMHKYLSLYAEKELIGRGNYGKVYLVVSMKTFKLFVSKKIQLEGLQEQQIQIALKEVSIHQQLKHVNILEFKQFFLQDKVLIMIMEYCEFGDLSTYIKNRKEGGQYFEEALILNLFIQMLFGLNYLHENKIMHRDIKTQNIFINSQGRIKIADFGISKIMEHTQQLAMTVIGTPYYLSPQACNNSGYTFKSDIWSLGCVLYQMCTLKHPFQGTNVLSLAKKITTDQPNQIPKFYSKQLSFLIKWMLKKDPNNRPATKQILDYQFLSKYLEKFAENQKPRQNVNKSTPIKNKSKSNKYEIIQTQTNLIAENNITLKYSPQQQIKNIQLSPQIEITPKKSGLVKLKQRCVSKMGQKLFKQIYEFMRKSKIQGFSQIQIQKKVKQNYNKTEFDLSMDVAQLIYIEDNS